MKPDQTTQEQIGALAIMFASPRVDLSQLKGALIALLEHLCSPTGRTDENCRAVDSFLCMNEEWIEKELPSDFHDLLTDMGGALHDTVTAPEVAENFESTPEQLLRRARMLVG